MLSRISSTVRRPAASVSARTTSPFSESPWRAARAFRVATTSSGTLRMLSVAMRPDDSILLSRLAFVRFDSVALVERVPDCLERKVVAYRPRNPRFTAIRFEVVGRIEALGGGAQELLVRSLK